VSIGAGSVIERSRVRDTIVGEGARVVSSEINDSLVGDGAVVESFDGSVSVSDHSEVHGAR
jgi:hypothetical protein